MFKMLLNDIQKFSLLKTKNRTELTFLKHCKEEIDVENEPFFGRKIGKMYH
jgi:hypothetical protein